MGGVHVGVLHVVEAGGGVHVWEGFVGGRDTVPTYMWDGCVCERGFWEERNVLEWCAYVRRVKVYICLSQR